MSATAYPSGPQQGEPVEPGGPIPYGDSSELEKVRLENAQLRELVIQLSRLIVQNATVRK